MSNLLNDNRPTHAPRGITTSGPGDSRCACRITLRGKVQGLGVRPAVARLAHELGVAGSVRNSSGGVTIEVEGLPRGVELFRARLVACLPPQAVIQCLAFEDHPPRGQSRFRIDPSSSDGPPRAHVPPDVATCGACRGDVAAAGNRRRGYVFTTCTRCGPRYSLIEQMPYDRAATAMSRFSMCDRCGEEYAEQHDRRFHSQTNCCPACGPRLWLSDGAVEIAARDAAAIHCAASALRAGRIVAMRGIGGYQLLVDATSESAVRMLRLRKRREGKPLAVMVHNQRAAKHLAIVNQIERESLASPANPIVVTRCRGGPVLAPSVTAGLGTVGLMLPTTPLHDALARAVNRPLVATSGNLEDDPLSFGLHESAQELAGVADVWLHHDRPIARPIDDSVVQVIAGRAATVRLARGLAPLPLAIESRHRVLALGGHQKAAIALANGAQAVLGPHVGDLQSEASRRRYLEQLEALRQLYQCEPQLVAHDEHPDYFTTQWAARQAIPSMPIQHHHAHVAAGMIEPGWLEREVLGVAWDGTGYGPDGSIWGGEFLAATAVGYRRVAHLRTFSLPGGELAVREPWRVAVAVAYATLGPAAAAAQCFERVAAESVAQVVRLVEKPRLCTNTSSAGRLFDAVSALVVGATHAQFEGQAAMRLEAACDPTAPGAYELPYVSAEPGILDWRPTVRDLLRDRQRGASPGEIAMRFHRALAGGIAQVARQFSHLPVLLGGGCFHNKVLTELVATRLAEHGHEVATPGIIPVGDGGLAAGQLAIAAARWQKGWRPCV
jgi:hydrogenase maturation protein HypF